jgi:hypothetical protein
MKNSTSFLSVTHMTMSAKWFRSYEILKIDFIADICFWTELRLNGTQLLCLGLAKTLEVPNTIMVANSLTFLMVHNTALNGEQFMSYDSRKLYQFAKSEFWADWTFWSKSGF